MTNYEWSRIQSTQESGRTFARPLGLTETSFYYDRVFNGTADIVWHYRVEQADTAQARVVFSEDNVKRAWATLKQYYPLLGSRMELQDDDTVVFVVTERALSQHQPDEVTLRTIDSAEDVEAVVWRNIRDKPMEDGHITARIFILARKDKAGTYEVLFKAAHAISDGISGATIARSFFDVLCSPPIRGPPLEERLAMALPPEALDPALRLSASRQRWRRAVGKVIFLNMRKRLAGGHTIPRTITEETYRTPSLTQRAFLRLSPTETRTILDSCRRNRVTFGSVIPVISQMAFTRFLHRRYLRGDIPEEEWEYRRRQPMHYGGPLNLRPHLDEEWQRKGGASEVSIMIDYYDCTLPFMPSPYGTRKDASVPRVDGAPPFSALLSRARFFYRAKLARQQLARAVKHPLLLEIAHARQPLYLLRKKRIVTHWQASLKGEPLPDYPELDTLDAVAPDFCFTGGVSSVGDMTLVLPSNYPLPSSHPLSIKTPQVQRQEYSTAVENSTSTTAVIRPQMTAAEDTILRIVDGSTYLHSRPTEFFLANSTTRNCIDLALTYDANVYRQEDAEEYLQECREAAMYYLGDHDAGSTKSRL
ncbi:hypothetical protein BV20DRAFT_1010609 [Pilatotrama ljubarskyi]|nr:hypothetical protein BV20DRAFT_1010609 [Pilatotrama ljubarskyi]